MNIIIVGCGKVGSALAAQLSQEDNNICIVDQKRDRIEPLTAMYDVMGICGNGSNYSVLQDAGIIEADLLIAVTESDELNLLCCVIAQKAGKCRTMARVRNPVYEREARFLQQELGLSMIINPELVAAREIFHILCFPNAVDISLFSKGQVEMIRYRIPKDSVLDNMKIMDVSSKLDSNLLIGSIESGGSMTIPTGNSVLHSGDIISIITSRKSVMEFFKTIHSSSDPVKNTMIIGGGKIAVYLTRMLEKNGINVKIIESNADRCDELCEILPETTIIHGDGSHKELLMEEHIEYMDSFVALTNFDEENILLSLFANRFVQKKVVTKINRFQLNEVIYNLDLDSVVYPKNLTTERILQYVRSTQNSIGSNIRTLCRFYDNKVEALEFYIKSESPLTHIPLENLNLKSDLIIGSIIRNGRTLIPNGQDMILPGDSIIIVTTRLGLKDARDILNTRGE